jgi:hypothetical protein
VGAGTTAGPHLPVVRRSGAALGVILGSVGVLLACALPWAQVGATWRSGFRFADLLLSLPDLGVGVVGPGGVGVLWFVVPLAAAVAPATLLGRRRPKPTWATVVVAGAGVVATVLVAAWMHLAAVTALGVGPAAAAVAGTCSLGSAAWGRRPDQEGWGS